MLRNLTFERIVKWALGLTGVYVMVWVVSNYSNLFTYLVISVLLSYLLDPIVNRLQGRGVNRTLAIAIILAAVGLLLTWVSTTVFPIFYAQMLTLVKELNIENIRYIASQIETVLTDVFEMLPQNFLVDIISTYGYQFFDIEQMPVVFSNLIGIFTNVFSALLVIPFATFFFLKDGSKIRRDILQLIPNTYFETTLTIIDKIESRLGSYFRSVLLQSTIVATLSWLFLGMAGLENALSVGITIGAANSIPYFGPIIGYLLSTSVSIIETGDFSLTFGCLAAVFAVQIIDNVILQPMLFSRSADLHPVAILFLVLVGAETAGVIGMLVAIPIATSIKIMVTQISWSLRNYKVFQSDSRTLPSFEPPPAA